MMLLSICAPFVSLAILGSALSLPRPTGPYHVGSKAYVLNHITLNDPVAPSGTSKNILTNVYYPTHDEAPLQKYAWAGLAAAYASFYHLPTETFESKAHIAFDAAPLELSECNDLKLPTLLFGPSGYGPPSQYFFGLISDLVSKGYVVLTVDHPWEAPYLEYPDGTNFTGHDPGWNPPGEIDVRIHEYRLTDNSAVLDALPRIARELGIPLNLTHFAFFGHSLGGSASLNQILVEKNRTESVNKNFLGALNLDGSIFGPARSNDSSSDIKVPSFLFATSGHHREADFSWPVFEKFQSSWRKDDRIESGSNHTDFSDLIFLKQTNGIAGGDGVIAAARFLEIERKFVGDFFTFINDGGEGSLKSNKMIMDLWPEVVFGFNDTGDPCEPNLCWAPVE